MTDEKRILLKKQLEKNFSILADQLVNSIRDGEETDKKQPCELKELLSKVENGNTLELKKFISFCTILSMTEEEAMEATPEEVSCAADHFVEEAEEKNEEATKERGFGRFIGLFKRGAKGLKERVQNRWHEVRKQPMWEITKFVWHVAASLATSFLLPPVLSSIVSEILQQTVI